MKRKIIVIAYFFSFIFVFSACEKKEVVKVTDTIVSVSDGNSHVDLLRQDPYGNAEEEIEHNTLEEYVVDAVAKANEMKKKTDEYEDTETMTDNSITREHTDGNGGEKVATNVNGKKNTVASEEIKEGEVIKEESNLSGLSNTGNNSNLSNSSNLHDYNDANSDLISIERNENKTPSVDKKNCTHPNRQYEGVGLAGGPTCYFGGSSAYYCPDCGIHMDVNDNKPLPHDYSLVDEIVRGDCVTETIHRYTCSRCGNWYDQEMGMLNGDEHEWMSETYETLDWDTGNYILVTDTWCKRCGLVKG